MCAVPDKAVTIRKILNVQMTSGLASQVWSAGEHLIYNLKAVMLLNNKVTGFRVLTASRQTSGFSHNML
jgi:hypothetical protein